MSQDTRQIFVLCTHIRNSFTNLNLPYSSPIISPTRFFLQIAAFGVKKNLRLVGMMHVKLHSHFTVFFKRYIAVVSAH